MVRTPSTMAALGTSAPAFSLPDPKSGGPVSLGDFADAPALLVAFLSNHCPFVKHIADELSAFSAGDAGAKGVAVVGINANDVATLPGGQPREDGRGGRARRGYTFPYLFDASQEIGGQGVPGGVHARTSSSSTAGA